MVQKIWGTRTGHSREIAAKPISYLQAHPENYCAQMDTLLDLLYQSYTESNSVETPEFKAVINPLDRTLRDLADTEGKTEAKVDEETDEHMNIVFEMCTAYEH